MPEVFLAAETREDLGTRPARRLRGLGRIPAIVYGHGDKPVSVSVDARALRTALSSPAGENALFDLEVHGEVHLAIARELQRHPVRHSIAHIDFQVVSRDEVVSADVPIVFVGDGVAITREGGTIEQAMMSLRINAKPLEIPPSIEVDISGLEIGSTIRLSEVNLPAGVSTDLDPETTVAIGQAPRVADLGEVTAATAEGEAAAPAGEAASSDNAES